MVTAELFLVLIWVRVWCDGLVKVGEHVTERYQW
jgi:hypothetical protein